jgi:hypothetical protein
MVDLFLHNGPGLVSSSSSFAIRSVYRNVVALSSSFRAAVTIHEDGLVYAAVGEFCALEDIISTQMMDCLAVL